MNCYFIIIININAGEFLKYRNTRSLTQDLGSLSRINSRTSESSLTFKEPENIEAKSPITTEEKSDIRPFSTVHSTSRMKSPSRSPINKLPPVKETITEAQQTNKIHIDGSSGGNKIESSRRLGEGKPPKVPTSKMLAENSMTEGTKPANKKQIIHSLRVCT